MDLQHLLQRLESIIMEGRRVPGTQLRMVDAQRCFQLIDQMVLAIPEEIKKAQQTESERDRILAQSREEAERVRQMAHEDARRVAEGSNITMLAQQRAAQIEDRAHREAERMKLDADTYAMDTLRRFAEELDKLSNTATNGISRLEESRTVRQQKLSEEAG
jgi:hypothetical protein